MSTSVVITGMGVLTPIANGVSEFSRALRAGESGEGPITKFDVSRFPVKRACEIKSLHIPDFLIERDPFIQYGFLAAQEALVMAGLVDSSGPVEDLVEFDRIGVTVSSSKGGMTTASKLVGEKRNATLPIPLPSREGKQKRKEKRGQAGVTACPLFSEWKGFREIDPSFCASLIANHFGFRGPMKCVVAACATGTFSVIEGVRLIEADEADLCVAGASDASMVPLLMAGYHKMGVLSKNGMCPYDARRSGFLVGEGAGVVVLEREDLARSRGAKIYGRVLGTAIGVDPHRPIRFDHGGEALARMLKELLTRADLGTGDLDYINTHGTSTPDGDRYEMEQIKKALGSAAYRIPLSSTKSMVGHMLGAAGAVELIACLTALQENFIPPTIHYEKPDPACDLDVTPNHARAVSLETACSFSLGFGGQMAGIVIGK